MSGTHLKLGTLLGLAFFACFTILLLASFYFQNLNVDWPYYLSEIVCSGPSASTNCVKPTSIAIELFKSSPDNQFQVSDFGVRYTSELFAKFVSQFIGERDSLSAVILKLHILKSLIGAVAVTLSLYLGYQYSYTRSLVVSLLICVFSLPYTSFMAASVYPASIATVALVPLITGLKVLRKESVLSPATWTLFIIIYLAGFLTIFANRFETSVFLGVALGLFTFQEFTVSNSQRSRALVILLLFIATLSLALSINPHLRSWFQSTFSGNAKVLNPETTSKSAAVATIGEIGLSATAPVTAIDNTSRNLVSAVDTIVALPPFFTPVVVSLFWIPLLVLIGNRLYCLFAPFVLRQVKFRKLFTTHYPELILLAIFFSVPYFARTVWFFQYWAPLAAIFIFFSDSQRVTNHTLIRLVYVGSLSNLFVFLVFSLRHGTVYLGSFSLSVGIIISTGLCSAFILYVTSRQLFRSTLE